ncbi:hypothetical protein [Streptomyces noursei]|uniref:hypothetical protein n=1 Tax=Streptomyces noursei TaxID=1971 RepID=UPI0016785921|nr:hypothetical protein [Streptomyces noursei]MCZ1013696.1 hypothetical protein [Streptomyces noursei]GGX24881.1 hypothetical protein GCM10010341_52460 [Streptomyces noursei]
MRAALPPLELSPAWHPRDDADPAHQWLRSRIRDSVRAVLERDDTPTHVRLHRSAT